MLVTVRYCRDKRATRVSIRLAKDDSTYYIKPFQRSYAPPRGQIGLAKDWIVPLAVQFINRMPLDHSSLQSPGKRAGANQGGEWIQAVRILATRLDMTEVSRLTQKHKTQQL